MKTLILTVSILLISTNSYAGLLGSLIGSAGSAVGSHKTKEYNKGVEAYNQALEERRNGDYKKAISLFKVGCDKKLYDSCAVVGEYYVEGNKIKKNILLGAIYLKKACDGGHKEACSNK